jgi:hypothetical protein
VTLRHYGESNGYVRATWGNGERFARIIAGHRGGVLWCSEITVWERGTGRSKSISSTMGLYGEEDAKEETTCRYMAGLWEKHLG